MLHVTDKKADTQMNMSEREAVKKYGGVAYNEACAGINPDLEIVDLSSEPAEDDWDFGGNTDNSIGQEYWS